ncbi:hypothetical protein Tco_0210585, partial [Tanacetum coccineum]
MNEDYYHEQNSCYDHNSFGFDQFQPPQYTVNHPIFNSQNELLNSQNKLMEQMATLRDLVDQAIQKKRIAEDKRLKIDLGRFPFATMMTKTILLQSHPLFYQLRNNEHSEIVVNSDDDNFSSDDD